MRRLIVLMTFVLAVTAPAYAGTAPRIALVIGNGNYEKTASLSNPVNDARLIAKTLRMLEFEVIERVDLKQKEMKRAIRDFGERLERGGEAAVGLFYYAGHGVQVGGRNYVVPVDADISRQGDVDIEALAADAILSTIAFANNGINFVILDACRNNPYERSFRSASRGLARMDAPRGSLVAYATAPGDVAADGKGDNSPYTEALAKAMTQTGMSAEHVFRRTRQLVMASTNDQQVPWEASSLTGDFFFSAEKAEPPAPETTGPSAEMVFWQSIQSRDDPAAFRGYLEQYPEGTFAVLARANLNFLERQ